MKKTFITALAMLVSVGAASAADPATTILQLTQNGTYSTGTIATTLVADGTVQTNGTTNLTETDVGGTGISVALTISNGKQWSRNFTTTTWSNDKAIEKMASDLGVSITSEDLLTSGYSSPGAGGSNLTSAAFTFADTTGYTLDTKVVCYITMAGLEGTPSGITVTGLSDATISYATATMDTETGFDTSYSGVANGGMVIARVEGVLSATTLSFGFTGGSKRGVGVFAIAPVADTPSPAVPEPATATLSLLALAGLAARRRRK